MLNVSLKIYFPNLHLYFIPKNLHVVTDEPDEHFKQDLKIFDTQKRTQKTDTKLLGTKAC